MGQVAALAAEHVHALCYVLTKELDPSMRKSFGGGSILTLYRCGLCVGDASTFAVVYLVPDMWNRSKEMLTCDASAVMHYVAYSRQGLGGCCVKHASCVVAGLNCSAGTNGAASIEAKHGTHVLFKAC